MAKTERVAPAKATAGATPLEKLQDFIRVTVGSYTNPEPRSNEGRLLHDIWVWQEVAALAGAAEKAAWQAAQLGDDALIPTDAELRGKAGEAIVADSAAYSCIVRVDGPRKSFDRDTFIALVARKFKIPAADIAQLAELAKVEGASPLTKRVVPAEPTPKKKR